MEGALLCSTIILARERLVWQLLRANNRGQRDYTVGAKRLSSGGLKLQEVRDHTIEDFRGSLSLRFADFEAAGLGKGLRAF